MGEEVPGVREAHISLVCSSPRGASTDLPGTHLSALLTLRGWEGTKKIDEVNEPYYWLSASCVEVRV